MLKNAKIFDFEHLHVRKQKNHSFNFWFQLRPKNTDFFSPKAIESSAKNFNIFLFRDKSSNFEQKYGLDRHVSQKHDEIKKCDQCTMG